MEGKRAGGGRIQQGTQHIIIRKKLSNKPHRHLCPPSNPAEIPLSTSLLFQTPDDKFTFLTLLDRLATRFRSRIFGFILMDTHAHLLVESRKISIFIGTLCSRYARIYHKKYATEGELFQKTFVNHAKDYELWKIDTLLYILNNPLEAGICSRHKDFIFSSYKLHVGLPSPIQEIIHIDNSLVTKYFKNKQQFKSALKAKLKYQKNVLHIKYAESSPVP